MAVIPLGRRAVKLKVKESQRENPGGFAVVGQLVLASASPRRQRFLRELGLDFLIKSASIDERNLPGESPEDFVLRMAKEKAEVIALQHPESYVLAADTIVVLDGKILGKPADAADAEAMLGKMSGKSHEVLTGFCLCRRRSKPLFVCRAVKTKVFFRSLSDELIAAYVSTREPLDKAGSYGLQGRGGFLVEKIDGSYSNVIGLPLAEVVEELLCAGVVVPVANS